MKNGEIKKYWKEERETDTKSFVSKVVGEQVDAEPFVEHAGGTEESIKSYRKYKCMPCPRYC